MVQVFESRFERLETHMKTSLETFSAELQEAEQERVALGERMEVLEEEITSLYNKVVRFLTGNLQYC